MKFAIQYYLDEGYIPHDTVTDSSTITLSGPYLYRHGVEALIASRYLPKRHGVQMPDLDEINHFVSLSLLPNSTYQDDALYTSLTEEENRSHWFEGRFENADEYYARDLARYAERTDTAKVVTLTKILFLLWKL